MARRSSRPRTLPQMAQSAARQHGHPTARRAAARSSTARGVQLALGEQTTTVYADPSEVAQRARRGDTAAQASSGSTRTSSIVQLRTREPVRLRRSGSRIRRRRAVAREATSQASTPIREEKRLYPQHRVGSAGARVRRASTTTGLEGLEIQYNKQLSGRPGKQTVVADPFGRAIDVISSRPGAAGRGRLLDDRPHDPGEAEPVLRADARQVAGEGRERDRPRPAHGRRARDGAGAGLQREQLSNVVSQALQRNRAVTDMLRAGLDVQARDDHGGALRELVTPTTKFTLPYSIHVGRAPCTSTTPRSGRPRRTHRRADPRALVERRRGHDRRDEARPAAACQNWIHEVRLRPADGHRLPGREPGLVLPLDHWTRSTIGNVPIGQGISVTPIQLASVYAAIANGGVWIQPHLVDRVGGRAPDGAEDAAHHVARGRRAAEDDAHGRRLRRRRDRHRGRRFPATPSPARPAPRRCRGRAATAGTDYVATFVGMVPGARIRASSCSSPSTSRAARSSAASSPRRPSPDREFDLQYLEVPPDLAVKPTG